MMHKSNLFSLSGGMASYDFHSHRGKFDAYYVLYHPDTNIPLTNEEVYSLVQNRCASEPYLHSYADYLIPDLEKKAGLHPNSEFRLSCRGDSKEEALKLLRQNRLQHLTDLANVLFRPNQKAQACAGKLTLSQFFFYAMPGLMLNEPEDIRRRYFGVIENWILPTFGDVRLEQLTDKTQLNLCKKLNAKLKKNNLHTETVRLVRNAYKLLLEDSQQYYKTFLFSPDSISRQIAMHNNRNHEINNAFIARHLDPDVRTRYFKYLEQRDDNDFLAYINALVYSGLDCPDISALSFRALQYVRIGQKHFYKILADRRQYKNGKKHATRNILNKDCSFSCFRTVVFSPYATHLIDRRIEWFRAKGLSDEAIGRLSLSCEFPGTSTVNFTELEHRLETALCRMNIPAVSIPRTKKNAELRSQIVKPDYQLIKDDALYVVQYICHMPLPLLHTMFDARPTETDEISYLDLDSDELSRTHYLFTRRFSAGITAPPHISAKRSDFFTGTQPHAVKFLLRFDKTADISVHSDFAVNIKWKESSLCE